LHKSDARANLTADDRASLFEKAVKTAHKKYELMPLSLEDADKLDDAYNLDVLIKYTKRSHYTYDMHDVFLIVYPKDGSQANVVDHTKDLYTEYPDITIEDVARSNEWYRTWMNEDWFVQNLQLTHTFFQNNVLDKLWMKVSKTYESYKAGKKGGPLFFILMMNHLLSDTEEAASALVTKVLPEDIIKILLQVFQTSSVADFNVTFLLLEKQRRQHAVLRRTGAPPDLLPSDTFTLAESEYRDMQTLNKWSGIHTKGESAFHAGQNPSNSGRVQLLCFNCGGQHHVKQCTLPRDEAKINKASTDFMAKVHKKQSDRTKRNGGSKDDKWSPALPHESNKRVIDGKPMFYMKFRKRWVPDKAHAGKEANLANKKKKKVVEETLPASPDATESEPDCVLLANKFKQLQATFTAFSNDLLND
jgi:hypothetical protein